LLCLEIFGKDTTFFRIGTFWFLDIFQQIYVQYDTLYIFYLFEFSLCSSCSGWWVGKANNGVAVFGVGFALWCERSEHDKANLANCSISAFFPFPKFLHFSGVKNSVSIQSPIWHITPGGFAR